MIDAPQIKVKPPIFFRKVIFPQVLAEEGMTVHLPKTIVYKGKTLRIPMCGAMSTIMTDDIKSCTCKDCISMFLRKAVDVCLNTKIKDKGDKEDESESYRDGIHS